MLIQSFENKSNLAEWFEHRNHYSVVVTRHKDNKRTEYKLQKNDYVYDMLKVKASVTALVNCAKDLIVNFSYISPTVTTDTKSESAITRDSVGVVESEGEALFDSTVCSDCGKEFERSIKTNLCYDCDFYYALNPQFRPKPDTVTTDNKETLSPIGDGEVEALLKSKSYLKCKIDDPENYRHEVAYAPVDDFDDMIFRV